MIPNMIPAGIKGINTQTANPKIESRTNAVTPRDKQTILTTVPTMKCTLHLQSHTGIRTRDEAQARRAVRV
jgi:hypothetical protein